MTSIEKYAQEFATRAHEGQLRKYTFEAYIIHPASVVDIVRSVSHTPEMLAAAWLHDVVEDCDVLLTEIQDKFGYKIARMVDDLTDISIPSDGNRKIRKAIDRKHTAMALAESKTIKLADLIDNTDSIVKHDPDFAKVYLEEKRELLQVLKEGNFHLWNQASMQLKTP